LELGSGLIGSAAKRRPDAEIADIENQDRPHGFACLPALVDKRRNALDTADGRIVVESHRRILRCRPYADQVRMHVIGVQDREALCFLLFRRLLPAGRAGEGVVLRVDRAHRHSPPRRAQRPDPLIRFVGGRRRQFGGARRSGYARAARGMIARSSQVGCETRCLPRFT